MDKDFFDVPEGLWKRIEFVREETLFELRAAIKSAPTAELAPVRREILNDEKLRAMLANGDLRVNVGCGHLIFSEFLNVDRRRLPGVDVLADVDALPFDPGTVVELYTVAGSGHEWPGSWPPLAGHDLPGTALDATRAIWDAFSKEVDKSS